MTGWEALLCLGWLAATIEWSWGRRRWLAVGFAVVAGVLWVLVWLIDGPRWALAGVEAGLAIHLLTVTVHLLRRGWGRQGQKKPGAKGLLTWRILTGVGLTAGLALVFLVPAPLRDTPASARMTSVDIHGHRMRLVAEGTGPTVILAAGGGITNPYQALEPLFARLRGRATVATYERPGYGLSPPTRVPRDAVTVVAEMRALFEGAHLKPPFVLVGHSLASIEVLLYAQAHPDEVKAVILLDGAPPSFYQKFSPGSDLETMAFELLTGVTDTGWEGSFLWPNAQAFLSGPRLTVPLTTFVAGTDPRWLEAQKEFATLGDTTTVFLPEASHWVFRDAPDKIATVILRSLP